MKTPEQLPSVGGRMEMTHADFQHACQVMLGRLQEDHLCDNRMVHLLCEAVRCSRECCELAVAPIQSDARADLEAENKVLRERAEKAEAAYLTARECLAQWYPQTDKWSSLRQEAMSSNCGQSLLDQLKSMENVIRACLADENGRPVQTLPDSVAEVVARVTGWEALKAPKT